VRIAWIGRYLAHRWTWRLGMRGRGRFPLLDDHLDGGACRCKIDDGREFSAQVEVARIGLRLGGPIKSSASAM